MQFQKAVKEKIWIKVLLSSPSGGGKSYSALRLATGIAKAENFQVGVIDTENGRIRYYANEFDFMDLQLSEPYSPEKYIEAIDVAISAGIKVLVIDSITHEWLYCNDVHDKMPGNSWTNWAKITPRHNAFMEKVLKSPLHIVATVRGKDAYVLEEKNGKQAPKKVGLGYAQREGVEYNYTVTFNLDQQTHVAEATKDNTHLFEGRYEMLTERDGEALYNWANSGAEAVKITPVVPEYKVPEVTLDHMFAEIAAVIEDLKAKEVDKTTIANIIKNNHTTANYQTIKDVEKANLVLADLVAARDEINE